MQLVPLHRGGEGRLVRAGGAALAVRAVGRCTLNSVDPQLESDWFQTFYTLEHQSWFQNVPFKFNLRRLQCGG